MTDLNTDESNLPLLLRHRWPEWLGFGSLFLALVFFVGLWLIQDMFLDAGIFRWLPAQGWIRSHAWWLLWLSLRWENYGGLIYLFTSWIAFTVCYVRIVRHILDRSRCGFLLWLSAMAAVIALLLLPLAIASERL